MSYTNYGQLILFIYEIDQNRQLVIEGSGIKAYIKNLAYDTILEIVKVPVEDSVYTAVADIGETPQIAKKIMQIFGSEINFSKDLHEGDWFTVLIEKRMRDGKNLGYGRVLASEFHLQEKVLKAYMFSDSGGRPQYYNEQGHNLRKTFLQTPLAVMQITSKFTTSRLHPVLGEYRQHLGVDYAAPAGTPVRAVADGRVKRIAMVGGFGNQVILSHRGQLESWYSHLQGFAAGLREGQIIEQGTVIGYVGSTGLATGPHLDLRFKQGNNFIDPSKLINKRAIAVHAKDMKNFQRVMRTEQEYLLGKRSLADYTPESLVFIRPKEEVSKESSAKNRKRNNRLQF